MLVFAHRQDQKFYSTLAGLYSEGSEGRNKAFGRFVTACFPHQVRKAEQTDAQIKETLERMCQQGPMVIG